MIDRSHELPLTGQAKALGAMAMRWTKGQRAWLTRVSGAGTEISPLVPVDA